VFDETPFFVGTRGRHLGHAMMTNTYWYLTGIPQLMAVAAERFETFTQMPEVCHD
jgi:hypothetical protein